MWWLFTPAAEALPPGVDTVDPGQAVVRLEAGLAATLPTLLAGATLGASDRTDVSVEIVTHAGLAWDAALGLRHRLSDHATGLLALDESFFTVEALGGVRAADVPFGNRLALTPALAVDTPGAASFAIGFPIRLARVEARGAPLVRAPAPALEAVWAEVAASWGPNTLRLRLIVPVAVDFHVLGAVPWIAGGHAWTL